MASKGLNLIRYSFAEYTFERGTPGEYNYRLELLDELPTHSESKEYMKFMEENGVECVDSYLRWVIFRKKAIDGPFEIYSDYESRVKHYQKAASLIGIAVGLNLFIAVLNMNYSTFNLYLSMLNWLLVIILSPVLISYLGKISNLKKEMELHDK